MSKFLGSSGTRKHIKLEKGSYSKDAPDVQIANVLEEQKNINGGNDLKKWSLSARKALKGSRSAAFLVSKGQPWSYEAPKLAMIVASPVIRDFFVQNPKSTEFPAINLHFKTKAIESIAHWLRISITVPKLGNIRMPKLEPKMSVADLKDSLDLRAAMLILGMEKYIDDFPAKYRDTLAYPGVSGKSTILRIPLTEEVRHVIDHAVVPTQDGRDAVVDVLADHLVLLQRKKMLGPQWNAFIGDFKNLMLAQAMKLAEARFTDEVKKERKERGQMKKEDHNNSDGVIKQGNIKGVAAAKNEEGTKETKQIAPKNITNSISDLLTGDVG
ncbi:hypothetical protein PMIN01_01244 [Paraphaeosphaeria minitans]|uniref:Uncharacterized protein n=1 Tax=Paraphaeosphaeria minitans TaxID=565426 RepID=A0A9P6GV76_9PLEO|nr:hypothetical protein PMIN01_01244 [Paraphaeosphaeria minitans]